MKLAAAIAVGLTLSATVDAHSFVPSEQVLAEMGLAGLEIMSDAAASAVRGHGFKPSKKVTPPVDKAAWYRMGIDTLREHVAEFQAHGSVRDSDQAAWLDMGKANLRSNAAAFKAKRQPAPEPPKKSKHRFNGKFKGGKHH